VGLKSAGKTSKRPEPHCRRPADNGSLWIGYIVGEPLESRRLLSNTLVFVTPPTNTPTGSDIDSPSGVQVAVENSFGNIVTTDTDNISLSLSPNSSALTGTTSSQASSGVATFNNLSVSTAGANYTLTAADASASLIATSQPFNVDPPPAFNFQSIASLNPNISPNGGFTPGGSLYIDGNGNIFGTTTVGGTSGDGTVYEIAEPSGIYSILISFTGNSGNFPGADPQGGLISDANGNLFGTTQAGGTLNDGTVFELAGSSYTFSSLISFTGNGGAYPGTDPNEMLTSDGNGNLFGITYNGGTSGRGTVFELAGSSYTFSSLVSFTGNTGAYPGLTPSALTSDGNGNLYGTTTNGGTVFELAGPSLTFSSLVSFTGNSGSSLGLFPSYAGLTSDGNGNLFGTTQQGGALGDGTVFELAGSSHTFSTVVSFTGNSGAFPGQSPQVNMTSDGNGNLFGTTAQGGTFNDGTIFELGGSNHTFSSLLSFTGSSGAFLGQFPEANLTSDGSGNLFGTTEVGGTSNRGTVFELAGSTYTFSSLLSFIGNSGTNPGTGPVASLIADRKGNLFGTTGQGGVYSYGTMFEIPASARNTVTDLVDFSGGPNGGNPVGAVFVDSAGNIIGTISNGGVYGDGTVFEITEPSRVYSTLFSFTGNSGAYPGANPQGGLISDGNGNLFGTTFGGGSSGHGTVFELAGPSYTFSSLFSFSVADANPAASLTYDGNGNLFGTTGFGGSSGEGTVFELVGPNHTFKSILSFTNGVANQVDPEASLTPDGYGNLLGTTERGGEYMAGTMFELSGPTHTFSTLLTFNLGNGAEPRANMITTGNGDLYGTTSFGGPAAAGTVFEVFGPNHTFSTLYSFTGNSGAYPGSEPFANLTSDSYGDLFGTTSQGGSFGDGTVFELTPSTKLSFPSPLPTAPAGTLAPIQVNVLQSSGTLSSADSSIVTLSIQSGPNGAILGGTTSVVAVNGVATFTNLTLSLPGNYTLIATDGSLSSAISPLTIQSPPVTWTGAADGHSWNNPGNWSTDQIPNQSDQVMIGQGTNVQVPANSSPLIVAGLDIVAGATLDLSNNDMIIHNGNLTQITPGIFSSSASTNTTLAIELNNDGHGNTLMTTFDNQPVTNTDVLVKYTYFGDANLNGSVDASDYIAIDNGFNQNLTGWSNGDFNLDGKINGDDYTLIDNAFNTQAATPLATVASPQAAPQLQISKAVTKATAVAIATSPSLSQDPFDPTHRRKPSLANEIFTD
jgi:uncharacterized repeat protein (TIGR03803 family)